MGKPEGKRPLGRPRRRWEDNIKIDLQEVGGLRARCRRNLDFSHGNDKSFFSLLQTNQGRPG